MNRLWVYPPAQVSRGETAAGRRDGSHPSNESTTERSILPPSSGESWFWCTAHLQPERRTVDNTCTHVGPWFTPGEAAEWAKRIIAGPPDEPST